MQGSNRPGKGWNRMECWTLYSLIQFRIYHRLELWARISFKIKPNPARFECFCWTILVLSRTPMRFLSCAYLTYLYYLYLSVLSRQAPPMLQLLHAKRGRASSVASPARPAAMQLECGMWHGALMVCILIIFINDVIYYSICIIFILYYIIYYVYIYIHIYIMKWPKRLGRGIEGRES